MTAASALDAARAALRQPLHAADATMGDPRSTGDGHAAAQVNASAASLLWRIGRRFPLDRSPVLQFVPCEAHVRAGPACMAFATAAAGLLGRTLLIHARGAGTAGPVPDAYVKRLYHQHLAGAELGKFLARVRSTEGGADGGFSAVAIDQEAVWAGDGACAAAPLCRGSILIVNAGETALGMIRSTASRLAAVGGHVTGTVMLWP